MVGSGVTHQKGSNRVRLGGTGGRGFGTQGVPAFSTRKFSDFL